MKNNIFCHNLKFFLETRGIESRKVTFISPQIKVAGATDRTKLLLSTSAKQRRNPFSRLPPLYQYLSMRHDWPVKKAIVDLPIRLKGKFKTHFRYNSLSPLGVQNKDIGAARESEVTNRS